MISGQAPVSIHELLYALSTCPSGARPRPIADGAREMRCVPVNVQLAQNGKRIDLHLTSWQLLQYVRANYDAEKKTETGELVPVGPEQLPKLVFHVKLPRGYRLIREDEYNAILSNKGDEAVKEDSVEEPLIILPFTPARTDGIIPELADIDPEVFKPNPESLERSMKRLARKPQVGTEQGP